MPTRTIAYLRVSTDKQADKGVSLDAQRSKVAAYAELYDLEITEVIVDAGASAKTLDRPGLTKALAMLRKGEADALLVVKLDRLTRSVRDLGELVERYFAPGKSALLSVGEQVDTRTAAGRLVLNVLASVSQWEREAIGERTRDALVQVRAEGGRIGRDGLGWRRGREVDASGRRVVVADEAETATLGRLRGLAAEGHGPRAIAATLTAEGHATKRGGAWAAETVRKVLQRAA